MNNLEKLKKLATTIITLIVISSFISIAVLFAIKETNLLPKKYVIHSQVYINSKYDDKEKKEDYLKYNEDYSILIYSPKFLNEVRNETNFKTISELKSHIKVIYTNTSHIITLQQVIDNKKKGLEIADIILSKFYKQASELITYNKLTVLSKPCIVQEITYSNTLILLLLDLFFFCLMLLVYLTYNKKKFNSKE